MQTFRQLFKSMTCDHAFNELYEQECNICPFTVRIFERIEDENIDTARLAATLNVPQTAIDDLKDADCCDPYLVIDLCRHLNLDAPKACPKIVNHKGVE